MNKTYQMREKAWLYPGKAGWVFVTVPQKIARDIDFFFSQDKRGWGSLPVRVTLGKTTWLTSIFTDKKSSSYLLPLKAEVRKKEAIEPDQEVALTMEIAT